MKNILISALAVLSLGAASAAEMRPEIARKIAAARMRAYGGDIIDRRNMKGSVAFVNAQKAVSESVLNEVIEKVNVDLQLDVKLVQGSFDIRKPECKATVTVFLIDDADLPMSLVASEALWAVVNVNKLKCDKPAFFEARVKKESYRVFGLVLGASGNKYKSNLFLGITKPEDLDEIVAMGMPADYRLRYEQYLPSIGIVPYRVTQYKKACTEGWAPAPTNEYQKAIWDKVHEMPTAPIKIKPEAKKVAE